MSVLWVLPPHWLNPPTPGTRRSGQNDLKVCLRPFKNYKSTRDFFQKITSTGHSATRCCLFDYNGLLPFWLHLGFCVPDNARDADLNDFWSTYLPNWSQHTEMMVDHWSVSGDLIQSNEILMHKIAPGVARQPYMHHVMSQLIWRREKMLNRPAVTYRNTDSSGKKRT